MNILFAHAGHVHEKESMDLLTLIDHSMPIIIGAIVIIMLLVAMITYFLLNWQPKPTVTKAKK